jgi:hypothetical protein
VQRHLSITEIVSCWMLKVKDFDMNFEAECDLVLQFRTCDSTVLPIGWNAKKFWQRRVSGIELC